MSDLTPRSTRSRTAGSPAPFCELGPSRTDSLIVHEFYPHTGPALIPATVSIEPVTSVNVDVVVAEEADSVAAGQDEENRPLFLNSSSTPEPNRHALEPTPVMMADVESSPATNTSVDGAAKRRKINQSKKVKKPTTLDVFNARLVKIGKDPIPQARLAEAIEQGWDILPTVTLNQTVASAVEAVGYEDGLRNLAKNKWRRLMSKLMNRSTHSRAGH